jgi:hypothetical protein
MSQFDARAVKSWLVHRDVQVAPPARAAALTRLRSAYGQGISPDLIALYEAFDGCVKGDFEACSFITIWPLAQALDFSAERGLFPRLAFADWSFSSDVAACDTSLNRAPVHWIGGCKPGASTFAEFWAMLMRGDLHD